MWQCFIDHYWSLTDSAAWCLDFMDILPYANFLCKSRQTSEKYQLKLGLGAYNCIVFEFFTCLAVIVGLGLLLFWHLWLVSTGQTSIEQHVNRAMRRKMASEGRIYRNPHDKGFLRNWQLFLSDPRGRVRWTSLFLFSGHKPLGDGLCWTMDFYDRVLRKEKPTGSHIV